jgi:RNA polymerase primary sigma factor
MAKKKSPERKEPVLDLAAVKKLIKLTKLRGWLTYDEINAIMPSDVTTEQAKDVIALFREMDANDVQRSRILRETGL